MLDWPERMKRCLPVEEAAAFFSAWVGVADANARIANKAVLAIILVIGCLWYLFMESGNQAEKTLAREGNRTGFLEVFYGGGNRRPAPLLSLPPKATTSPSPTMPRDDASKNTF